jgi:hypothetical protein
MTKSADMATLLDSSSKIPGTDIAGTSLPVASINASGTPSASTFLRGDGSWQAAGGGQIQSQLFTSSGSWTAPTGVTKVKAIVIGGGGGGARDSCGGGYSGAGAGYAIGVYTVTPGTAYTVTVGTGGAGSTTFNTTSGGTSSFGAFATATGGGAGAPGTSGSGSGGTIRNQNIDVTATNIAPFVGGRGNVVNTPQTFSVSGSYGAGQGGQGTSSSNGCGGVAGIVYLEWVG